ncbi:MAG TPA: glycosyltransferase [Thermoanaerobaculia bacterium]|jgi:glycosyltransferase involved in cell wall biosynthesis|nr:glycosyltransferase [Thermoanaerobaculia bacterium]
MGQRRRSQVLSGSRILVVAPQPFYEDRGTPIAVCQLLQALSQLAYEVDVLTYPIGRSIDIPRVRYFRSLNPLRLRQVPVGFSLRKLMLDTTLVAELARRLSTRAYFCVHALEEAAFPAVVLGRRFGVPVIYDMQSSLPEQLARLLAFRGATMQRALCRIERWLLQQADSVVSSSGLAARVRAMAPAARLREWEYSGTLPAASPEETAALRRDLGIPAGRPVVLYSGTFEPYQGLPTLFAAIPQVRAEVPDAVFVLVGAPETGGGTLVEREHVDLIRDGALRVIKRQPRERIPAFLALADVVVSPRAYGDNLPLKIFDYLAAGKPIVATDIPAHRSALTAENALLTGTGAPDLARGIARLLRDPELAARLAAAGRSYAEEKLGWFSFVRSVGDLYGEIHHGNGHPRESRPGGNNRGS